MIGGGYFASPGGNCASEYLQESNLKTFFKPLLSLTPDPYQQLPSEACRCTLSTLILL